MSGGFLDLEWRMMQAEESRTYLFLVVVRGCKFVVSRLPFSHVGGCPGLSSNVSWLTGKMTMALPAGSASSLLSFFVTVDMSILSRRFQDICLCTMYNLCRFERGLSFERKFAK